MDHSSGQMKMWIDQLPGAKPSGAAQQMRARREEEVLMRRFGRELRDFVRASIAEHGMLVE